MVTAACWEEHTAQGRERMSYHIKAVRDASLAILSLRLDFLNTFQINENHPGLARKEKRLPKLFAWPFKSPD